MSTSARCFLTAQFGTSNARIQAREQIAETKGKYMTRKPTALPREMSLETVREFERDQAVLTQQTLAKARRVRVAHVLPPHSPTRGQMGTARALYSVR
jgi:hypothetical protein